MLAKLQVALGGSGDDAIELHYPNAVSFVLNMAAKVDEAARTVMRSTFVESVDKRQALFTRWHREFLGPVQYLKSAEKRIDSLGLVKAKRMAIIGAQELDSYSATTRPIDLIKQLSELRFGVGRLANAKPWTVIVEADGKALADIKASLVRAGMVFADGYEDLDFNSEIFDRPVLINTGKENKKISAVSYDLRLCWGWKRSARMPQA